MLRSADELRVALRRGDYEDVRDEIRHHDATGVMYQKCLCDALSQLRDWPGAIAVAEVNLGTDSYFSELLLAKLHQNAQDIPGCWRWLDKVAASAGNTLPWLLTASKAAFLGGDTSKATELGQRVLQEKDRQFTTSVDVQPIRSGSLKRIVFSLFGTNEVYLLGALANARLWKQMAPDWTCRFYLSPDVPKGVAQALVQLGAEVMRVEHPGIPPYLMRFLPLQDPEIARFACRDVDCRPTEREIAILREWESSGHDFHVIRNHPLHTDLVLAGLWGGIPLKGFDLASEISACFPLGASNKYGLDQHFLERRLWARIRGNLVCHDPHYRLEGLDTRDVGDPHLGLGHRDIPAIRTELATLGIQIRPSSGD